MRLLTSLAEIHESETLKTLKEQQEAFKTPRASNNQGVDEFKKYPASQKMLKKLG